MTRDELHTWVKAHLRADIPRVAVCPDHCAPFDFLADVYFEDVLAAIAMANRGGAKTFIAAILHVLNAKFKPGCESASVGAIEAQARRAYQHVLKLLAIEGGVSNPNDNPEIESSIMLETRWKNSSKLEVLGGTVNAVNGPHPQKVHFDEVELADPEVFDESRNMSQSKDGIAAQDIITSTRKRQHGMMQKLIDSCVEAERQQLQPPYKLYSWCIFETAKCVPNCQRAHPGLSEADRCKCDKVVKGHWDDGTMRRFSDVCKGRLARSQGWIPLQDVHKTFQADSRPIWEAQQECIRPSTEGLVVPMFSQEANGVRRWEPEMGNGPIFMSIDFGGTNPHAVNWYQLLRYMVEAEPYHEGDEPVKLPEGAIVCFDEIYVSEVSNGKVAEMIIEREALWRKHMGGHFRVTRRFADPQGKAARLELKHVGAARGIDLSTVFLTTRDVKEHIKIVTELVSDGKFFVDVDRCQMFLEEINAWHYPRRRASLVDDPEIPVNDFDHCHPAGTMVSTARGDVPIESVVEGDEVLTREGYRRVEAAGITGFADDFVKVCTSGRMVVCTPNHPIFVKSTGWVRADELAPGDVVLGDRRATFPSSSSVASTSSATMDATTAGSSRGSGATSTGRSGSGTTARYRRTTRCTTSSATTLRPSTLPGFVASRKRNTRGRTRAGAGQATALLEVHELRGTPRRGSPRSSSASVVRGSSASTTVELVVMSVERESRPLQPVYDLTVAEAHEFFADGVLVHNCMSNWRYCVANVHRIEMSGRPQGRTRHAMPASSGGRHEAPRAVQQARAEMFSSGPRYAASGHKPNEYRRGIEP
jgi:hypothetical protein